MNKLIAFLFLFLIQPLAFGQTPLSPTEITAFKNKVTAESNALQTLTANFTQTKHISFLNKPITSTGTLHLKADNKLRWQYDTPTKYTVVFKDKKLFVNNQGKQSSVDLASNKQFEKMSKLISGSINGNMFNDADFNISYFKIDADYMVKLVPKDKDLAKYIKAIELYFDAKDQLVKQSKMIEPNNDYSVITFANKKINQPINDSVFNL
ncbi:outer membrane lipoprotein carrier protein LolA [Flavobacterium agricola]|uniref:Outer membrane lipoprotein carrier protein LolA n=1 Tax=Flavobacterium agricola TaxID=2870839 RepID=A0ABY6LZU3_9FLAO|nr:outer membrane lipoprotein carrier protein LolA [Flavobacterium agricola]UYW00990.1 outer membrane lipoprotein carrier protein LolA [Flavobacterium agricola]